MFRDLLQSLRLLGTSPIQGSNEKIPKPNFVAGFRAVRDMLRSWLFRILRFVVFGCSGLQGFRI